MTHQHLTDFDPEAALATLLGVEPKGLAGALRDGTQLGTALAAEDESARSVLFALVSAGGAAPVEWLEAEAATLAGTDAEAVDAALARLWDAGLVARDRGSRSFFLAPVSAPAITLALRPLVFGAEELVTPPAPLFDEHSLACAFHALRSAPPRLTREGRPHARDLDALAARLAHLAPADAQAWTQDALAILADFGLVVPVAGALETRDAAARRLASVPPVARIREFLATRGRDGEEAVVLLARLQAAAPTRPVRRDLAAGLLRAAASPLVKPSGGETVNADAALRALVQAGLAAPLDARTLALTAAGRAYPEDVAREAPSSVHVGADLRVLVPRGLGLDVHLAVGAVARLEAADVVATYRLDRDLVLEALDRDGGRGLDLAALAAAAKPAIPPAVAEELQSWRTRFGEVETHEGVVLACGVPARVPEFDAVVRAAESLRRRLIAPGVAVVAPQDHALLCDALAGAGLTVRRRAVPHVDAPDVVAAAVPLAAKRQPADAPAAAADPWSGAPDGGRGRRAAPPPHQFIDRLKDKYRRDFGRAQVESLDILPLDELLEMEDKGRVRPWLAGLQAARPTAALTVRLEDFVGEELQPVSAARLAQFLPLAVAAQVTCQLIHVVRAGQHARLVVLPLALAEEPGGPYLRARLPRTGDERLIAFERIRAIRVLPPPRT